MKLLAALFAAAAPAPAPAPVQHVETPAFVAEAARPAVAVTTDPLGVAAAAHTRAMPAGPRAAMREALHALAYCDFAALDLNGPHVKAGERINRKQLAKVRRVLAMLAERAA